MSTKFLRPLFLLSLLGLATACSPEPEENCPPCDVPSFPNVNGHVMEIHPAYIEVYGCETFVDMTIRDFSNFCAQFQDGDGAISSDPDLRNCDENSCEFYWVCDNGAPAR